MATLPTSASTQRRTPRPDLTVATYRGGIAEAENIRLGETISKLAEIERNRIDESVADEAISALRQKRFDLVAGEDGYLHVKGSRVVHTQKDEKPFLDRYRERFSAVADEVAEGLTSEAQRRKFSQALDQERLGFEAELTRHAIQETEKFHAEAKQGRINTELQFGVLNWADQAKTAESLAAINHVYDNMVLVDGQNVDSVNALRTATVSNFHAAVITQALAADKPEFATDYFTKNKDQILNAEVLGEKITNESAAKRAQQVGAEVATEFMADGNAPGNLEAMYAEVNKRLAGEKADVVTRARQEVDVLVKARRDALNNRSAAVYRMVLDNVPLADIQRTPEYRALSIEDQNKIIEKTRGDDAITTPSVVSYYKLINSGKLPRMSEDEVALFGMKNALGKTLTNKLLQLNSELRSPSKILEVALDAEAFNVAYKAKIGKDPHAKSNQNDVDMARYFAESRIDEAQRLLKRQLTRQEKDIFIAEALQTVQVPGVVWGTNPRPLYATPPEKIVVPAADKEKIRAGLKARLPAGIEPTEQDIQEVYRNKLQIPLGQ